tara:strand:+ start:1045 stop:2859 length:1815 start_codon:yes stop_codon:yes gene_type:complete
MNLKEKQAFINDLEERAVKLGRKGQSLAKTDMNAAALMQQQANEMIATVNELQSIHREESTSYTPEKISDEDLTKKVSESMRDIGTQAQQDFTLVNEEAMAGGLTPVPTLGVKINRDNEQSRPMISPSREEAMYGDQGQKTGIDEYVVEQVAQTVVPALASSVVMAAKTAGHMVSNVIPDEAETYVVEKAKQLHYDTIRAPWYNKASELWDKATGAVNKVTGYSKWKEKEPESAKLFEDSLVTGTMFVDRLGLGQKTGTKMSRWGQAAKKDKDLMETADLLSPVSQKIEGNDAQWDTSKRKQKYLPSDAEKGDIEIIAGLKDFKPTQRIGKNMEVLKKEIKVHANRLEQHILKAGNPRFDPDSIDAVVRANIDELVASPAFDAAKGSLANVEPMLEKFTELLNTGSRDAMGLLELRRGFDNWLEKDVQMSKLGGEERTAMDRVVRNVRNSLNSETQKIVPDAPIKRLLRVQTSIYNGKNRLAAKFDAQAKGLLGAISRGMYSSIGVKLPETVGALAAAGAMGVSMAAPLGGIAGVASVAGAGAGAFSLINVLRNPKTRIFLGESVVNISKQMKTTTDPIMLSMLKGDRALLLDMMQVSEEEQAK